MYDYGSDPDQDMMMDYDHHMNTGELEEYFQEEKSEDENCDYNDNDISEPYEHLLFWKPQEGDYTIEKFSADRGQYGRRFTMSWVLQWHEDIHKGGRYYMLRLDKEQSGIVWYGTFMSEPYRDRDPKDRRRKCWFVDILVTDSIKPGHRPHVTMSEIKNLNPDLDWEDMQSGQPISRQLAERFNELISINRFEESHPYKGYRSREAYEENERRTNKKFLQETLGCLILIATIILLVMLF